MHLRAKIISINLVLAFFTCASVHAAEPARPNPITSPRLYVLDCGTITNNKPENYGLSLDEVSNTNFANMCFLIVHPKGTLLWESGLPDAMAGKPMEGTLGWEKFQQAFKMNTLVGQLAEIGYYPADVNYLALSHYDHDHSGNSNLFAAHSTWLVTKPEWDAMFRPADGKPLPGHEDFDQLKNAKTVLVADNYDVFGDGSVIIRHAFGHTPGHIVLVVKLKNMGNVILGGDLFHYNEEIKLNRHSRYERDIPVLLNSRDRIEKLSKELNAPVWVTHDLDLYRKLKHSPNYYD